MTTDAGRTPPPTKRHRTEASQQDHKSPNKLFKDCTITFAADVSGSTRNRVLDTEKHTILRIGSELNQPAKTEAQVVPWSTEVGRAVPLSGVTTLKSQALTNPSKLCSSRNSIESLQKSSLWCLMTDGFVDEDEVQRFANAVPDIQLHGTPCILIIFGWRPAKPLDVNISVGYPLLAVAPHSLVLFHDIVTDEVWPLAAKGCFEALLPSVYSDDDAAADSDELAEIKTEDEVDTDTNSNPNFGLEGQDTRGVHGAAKITVECKSSPKPAMKTLSNDNKAVKSSRSIKMESIPYGFASRDGPSSTASVSGGVQWSNLQRIEYSDLATLRIPAPLPLSVDHVALSGNRSINIMDVLNNNVSRNQSFSILSNDFDRDTLLATASSRGMGAQANEWLRRSSTADVPPQVRQAASRGQRTLDSSRGTGYASLEGLGRSARLASQGTNMSTASTLVGEDRGTRGSDRTVVDYADVLRRHLG